MERLVAIFGLFVLVAIAYLLSVHKKQVNTKTVTYGLGLQFLMAILVLGIPSLGFEGPLRMLFYSANEIVISILNFTNEGSRFIFGDLLDAKTFGFIFAFQVLPVIIFMASLMAVFYHLGIMQKIVGFIAVIMQKFMGTSGAESLSVAANIFVGQTEAPLMIKPYVKKLTDSELLSVMIGGMATVAGGVLAAYVGLLKDRIPDIAGHLLTASVMSAPAALAIAKIMIPETKQPETMGQIPKESLKSEDQNVIEAAAKGASEGFSLALNVAAMLLAFIALIACANALLEFFGEIIQFSSWGESLVPTQLAVEGQPAKLSLSLIFGWVFAPIAWLMGISWNEAAIAGSLLGEKIVINEFVAYMHLSQLMQSLSDRTIIICSYALCGFANFSSIAIQIGGIGGIAPERRSDLARLGVKAIIGGSLAAFMTATIAGILI